MSFLQVFTFIPNILKIATIYRKFGGRFLLQALASALFPRFKYNSLFSGVSNLSLNTRQIQDHIKLISKDLCKKMPLESLLTRVRRLRDGKGRLV